MDNEQEKEAGSAVEEAVTDVPGDTAPTADLLSSEPISILESAPVPVDSPERAAVPEAPSASPLPTQRMPTLPQLALALGALALVFGLSYLPIGVERKKKEAEHPAERIYEAPEQVRKADVFKDVSITASAAYIWDVKNQRALYNKNAGSRLPLASLTKLMTTLVAYERLGTEGRIPITRQALLQEGDSALSSGTTFTLRNLADLTLIASSNDGAYALAAATGATLVREGDGADEFVAAMNAKAEEIGLSQSYFTNPTGLDVDGTTSGSYGSARDMAFLMEYLLLQHPQILEATREAASSIPDQEGSIIRVKNTNEIVAHIPGLIGSKTGFTSLAGGNLLVAYDAGLNRPIVIAVLGSSREGRFSDTLTLMQETARAIANESI